MHTLGGQCPWRGEDGGGHQGWGKGAGGVACAGRSGAPAARQALRIFTPLAAL